MQPGEEPGPLPFHLLLLKRQSTTITLNLEIRRHNTHKRFVRYDLLDRVSQRFVDRRPFSIMLLHDAEQFVPGDLPAGEERVGIPGFGAVEEYGHSACDVAHGCDVEELGSGSVDGEDFGVVVHGPEGADVGEVAVRLGKDVFGEPGVADDSPADVLLEF